MLGRVAEPGAEHIRTGAPELLAGPQVESDQSRLLVGGQAAPAQSGLLAARHAVDAVEPAAADADGVVAEARLGRDAPEDLAGMAIHDHQAFAGREIFLAREGGLAGLSRRVGLQWLGAADEIVVANIDVSPGRRFLVARRHREF